MNTSVFFDVFVEKCNSRDVSRMHGRLKGSHVVRAHLRDLLGITCELQLMEATVWALSAEWIIL